MRRLNDELLFSVREFKPDLLVVWRGIFVWPRTLENLRSLPGRPLIVSYNNDDPFGDLRHDPIWRLHLGGLPYYDLCFVYRQQNVAEYLAAGAKKAYLLRAHFDPELHYPMHLTQEARTRYASDVAFIGHYDGRDSRVECIQRLAASGVQVRVYGRMRRRSWLDRLIGLMFVTGRAQWPDTVVARLGAEFYPPVEGAQYTEALNATSLPLSFLSVGNRDTYTRRCFEIPACRRPLVSIRTQDLMSMFQEDVEAVFFSEPDELVSKVHRLLGDSDARERIAAAGYERVHRDGHDIDSRAREMLSVALATN